jgi:Ca-activated chloride channel homolog
MRPALVSLATLFGLAFAPATGLAGPTADDIRDIRGPIREPSAPPRWPYAAGAAGALAAAVLARTVARRRRAPAVPSEVALHELEAARDHIELADPLRFSTAVSDAIRTYVEQAFALHAPRLTTEELLAELMRDESPVATHRGELGAFLEYCDLAKYARWSLTRAQMTRDARERADVHRGYRHGGGRTTSMITFAYPQLLWLLLVLPVIALARSRRGRRAAIGYASTDTLRAIGHTPRARAGRLLPYLRLPAAALMIVALARPQTSHARTSVQASGVDIMLALDVSGSMGALDMTLDGTPADRLAVTKSVVARFIDRRPNDRMGLIAFAGAPYLVSPLTLDHDWVDRNLARVQLGTLEDGTAIGSGLSAAINRLRPSDAHTKVVVLLTDGVNNAGKVKPALAAEASAALGIRVYTIGVGTAGKAPVPVTDEDGHRRIVMAETDVDEKALEQIATMTGGRFFRATDTKSLEAVYEQIDAMEKTTREVSRFERRNEKLAWALTPALALLAGELLLSTTLLRRVP